MTESTQKHYQFRLMHLFAATFLVAAWLALFQLGGFVQLALVLYSYAFAVQGVRFVGRRNSQRWLELLGIFLGILSPFLAIGYLHLWATWYW